MCQIINLFIGQMQSPKWFFQRGYFDPFQRDRHSGGILASMQQLVCIYFNPHIQQESNYIGKFNNDAWGGGEGGGNPMCMPVCLKVEN